MFGLWKVLFYRNWQIFWEYCCPWVSFWGFAEIPITMISINFYGSLFPCFLTNFCFVNADDVWLWFLKIFIEIFFSKDCSDAINVPWRDEKIIWGLSSAILPICLICFSMIDIIAELFRPGFGWFALFLDNLFGEKFGLFFLFLLCRFILRFWFLIDFFWRHNLIILLDLRIKRCSSH